MKIQPYHLFIFVLSTLIASSCEVTVEQSLRFDISVDQNLHSEVDNGRLLLLISKNDENEPRFQINDGPNTQIVYGQDIEGWESSQTKSFTGNEFGYPVENIMDLQPGDYWIQAFFHKYETYDLANGHTVKLPASWEAGSRWNREPGNIYSSPIKVVLDPASNQVVDITMDQIIPSISPPEDTEYIKHIEIKSEMLSEFWGQDMFLGAHILLPEGFDEHPDVRYPLIISHGHFPSDFGGFRPEPPDPDLEPIYSDRFSLDGYNLIVQQEDHNFYKTWTGPDFPRVIIIEIQHANPYYDDSYAVNSANLGPYGDAITYELIPFIEKEFRGIGEGWSRFLYGGSTGGWEALAVQVMYPDEYNGCFAACPDPVDFRAYCLVNIYEDENAYVMTGDNKNVEKPAHRDYLGQVNSTMRQTNHKELALGTKTRSGQQWDIWEAVYSPVGEDGYPARLWDKYTGEIDHEVADYWKENYDLRYIMERDWEALGPKLKGKVNIYCGDMDNYYLNNAVYLAEDFLESTTDPYYDGEVAYGDGDEHCWNGDPDQPNAISRLRYHTMYMDKILARIEESAPNGADLRSWRY